MPVTLNDIINNAQLIADLINAGADKKLITDLPAATLLNSADALHISQGGTDKQLPASLLPSGGGGADPIFFRSAAGVRFRFPTSNPAPLSPYIGSNSEWVEHLFDDTTEEFILFEVKVPADLTGYTSINLTLDFRTSDASGGSHFVQWRLYHAPIGDGESFDGSYASNSSGDISGQSTLIRKQATINFTLAALGWAAGDVVHCKLSRIATSGTNCSGDLGLVYAEMGLA